MFTCIVEVPWKILRLFILTAQLFHKKTPFIVSYHFFSSVQEDIEQTIKTEETKDILHTHKVEIYDFQCFQFAFCSEISFIKCILNEYMLLMKSCVASSSTAAKLHRLADMCAFQKGYSQLFRFNSPAGQMDFSIEPSQYGK